MKYSLLRAIYNAYKSLPTRGAWIEMDSVCSDFGDAPVAPHTGSVD